MDYFDLGQTDVEILHGQQLEPQPLPDGSSHFVLPQQNDTPEQKRALAKYERRMKRREGEIFRKELIKKSQNLCIANALVKRPILIISLITLISILSIVAIVGLGIFKISEERDNAYLVYGTEAVTNFEKIQVAEKKLAATFPDDTPLRTQNNLKWITNVIFVSKGDNVMTPNNIELMYTVFNRLKNSTKTPNTDKFCLAASSTNPSCNPYQFAVSVVPMFVGIKDQSVIDKNMVGLASKAGEMFWPLFGRDLTEQNPKSKYTRLIFQYAEPIEYHGIRFRDKTDREEMQEDDFRDFSFEILEYIRGIDTKDYDMDIYVFSQAIYSKCCYLGIEESVLYAILCFVFVYAYITFHIRSLFLSTMGMIQILFSFPLSLLVYKEVFRIYYFSQLHALVVFIILGISADNIFIFTDAWNQAKTQTHLLETMEKQMAYTYRRAAKAIIATSLTTAIAFISTGFNRIMPISAFGYWATLIVLINLILTITFYPASLIVFEKYVQPKFIWLDKLLKTIFCCQCFHSKGNMKEKAQLPIDQQEEGSRVIELQYHKEEEEEKKIQEDIIPYIEPPTKIENIDENNRESAGSGSGSGSGSESGSIENNSIQIVERKFGIVERFFETKWNEWMYQLRFGIMLGIMIWVVYAFCCVLKMPGLSDAENYFKNDYDVQIARKMVEDDFYMGVSDQSIIIHVVWGVKDLDRSNVNRWLPEDQGTIDWDNNFDISSISTQKFLFNMCTEIGESDMVAEIADPSSCFIIPFLEYAKSLKATDYEGYVDPKKFNDLLYNFTLSTKGSSYALNKEIGFDGSKKLKMIQFTFVTSMPLFAPRYIMSPFYDSWNNLVSNYNNKAPEGLGKAFQTGLFYTALMNTDYIMIQGSLQGAVISFVFAFLTLVILSLNVFISLISILLIGFVNVCVLGFMQLQGWEYGMSESCATVVFIGLSVNYVVHIGHHYVRSPYPDRYHRTRDSLKEIGISVLGGAITTVGAGICLIPTILATFSKFGVLIVVAITHSLLMAIFLLPALLHIMGPQNTFGDITAILRTIKSYFRKTQTNDSQTNDLLNP